MPSVFLSADTVAYLKHNSNNQSMDATVRRLLNLDKNKGKLVKRQVGRTKLAPIEAYTWTIIYRLYMAEDGTLPRGEVRIFWSSPGYSHCCFTSRKDLDPKLALEIESAFLSVTSDDPIGRQVLEGEACDHFVPGIEEGWDLIEKAAEAEGLI